jgi:hypothetical protein
MTPSTSGLWSTSAGKRPARYLWSTWKIVAAQMPLWAGTAGLIADCSLSCCSGAKQEDLCGQFAVPLLHRKSLRFPLGQPSLSYWCSVVPYAVIVMLCVYTGNAESVCPFPWHHSMSSNADMLCHAACYGVLCAGARWWWMT